MFEYWTRRSFPGCKKPYEHAAQDFAREFLAAAIACADYDCMAAWLGHGDL